MVRLIAVETNVQALHNINWAASEITGGGNGHHGIDQYPTHDPLLGNDQENRVIRRC